jgi:methylenetetrahydrofolate reductase (NADPH)
VLLDAIQGTISSVELWPARNDEQALRLGRLIALLEESPPDFVSVTYGALGSARSNSVALVGNLVKRGFTVIAHLTCLGHTKSELQEMIGTIEEAGAKGILALRGDPPLDGNLDPRYEIEHAYELVQLIRNQSDLTIAVAAHPCGHPISRSIEEDRRFLAEKLALADFAITQFYLEPQEYVSLVDDLKELKVSKPILPGILVPRSPNQLIRMGEMAGIDIPVELVKNGNENLEAFRTGATSRAFELASRAMMDGAPGAHLFSMNSTDVTKAFLTKFRTPR